MSPTNLKDGFLAAVRCWRALIILGSVLGIVPLASAEIRDQVSVVKLLVLYTPQARDGAGGIAGIHKQIEQAVLEANSVLQNSRANVRFKLCLVARADIPESGSIEADFNRMMKPHDRYADLIRTYRAAAKADLVCLVTETGVGRGFYGAVGPSFTNAFSVIRQPYLTGLYDLPVALSYNFGCQAERGFTYGDSPIPYGYGYSFETTNGGFATVEAFGRRLPFFSNPDIIYDGVAAGVPVGQTNSANNVAVLNQAAPIIAGFYNRAPYTFPPDVRILSPTNNAVFKAGQNLKFMVAGSDIDGKIARVEYWQRVGVGDYSIVGDFPTNRLASSSVALKNFPALWRKAAEGNYSLVAVAVDNEGATTVSEPIKFSVVPSNDNFADAQIISGSFITVTNSATAATLEPGEPAHAETLGDWGSIWWSWTAPVSGWANLSSPGSDWGYLNVYEGTALTNLSRLASGDHEQFSALGFETVAGKTYYIAGMAEYGEFVLNVQLTTVVMTSPTNGAHFAYGAPIPISLTTTKNDGKISYVTFWDRGRFRDYLDSVENPPYSILWTNATPGQHYVLGEVVTARGPGPLWAPNSPLITVGPPNDDFVHGQIISSVDTLISNTLAGATSEIGEPPIRDGFMSNTVWLSWTAPRSGVVSLFDYSLHWEDHFYEVFSGDSLADLVSITNCMSWVTFEAAEGTTYSFRISGYWDDVLIRLFLSSFEITSPPSGAQFMAGTDIPITVDFAERDKSIRNVKFYANDVPIGTAYEPPFSFVWSNVVAGSYALRAVGTNNVDRFYHSSVPVPINVLPP